MALEYWSRGDIPPGPVKATLITDVNKAIDVLKKYIGSTTILLGSNLHNLEETLGSSIVDLFVELANLIKSNIVVSDSRIVRKLDEKKFSNYRIIFPLDFVRMIHSGVIEPKLIILAGFRYYYGWLLLNNLKHYKPSLATMSLDPYAQPNATWTLPSLPLSIWHKNILQLLNAIKSQLSQNL
ncbi:MAG: carbon monoxide dehydrogenase beta subunit family protein [Desulfurococcaceae archaeon]